jgi:hypothetical protein
MWQTKYALVVLENLGVGVNFRPCSEGSFLSGHPWSVSQSISISQPSKLAITVVQPRIGEILSYIRPP